MTWTKRNFRYGLTVLLLFVLFSSQKAAMAADGERPVLKVAFTEVKGMTEKDEDGTRHGLVVDYLVEIAKYTGWKYEYIDVEDASVMLDNFDKGEYDLMGGQYYLEGLEKYYGYPEYNTGYSRLVLLAREDDESIRSSDLQSMDGKIIGTYANAKERNRRLREFISINGLNCEIKEYSYDKTKKNLYSYLESGEVDILIGNAGDTESPFRVFMSVSSQPYYLVTTPDNQEVLDGLNMALKKIYEANPNFGTERYEANYPDMEIDIQMTAEERAYVRNKDTLTVAVPAEWHPLFCLEEDNTHNGIMYDILERVSAFSGLKFSYVYAKDYAAAIKMVKKGEAEILGFFLGTRDEAVEQDLALSATYTALNNIVVRNKAVSYPSEGLRASVLSGRSLPEGVEAAEVYNHVNAAEALAKINKGELDFVYGFSPHLESEIQKYHFNNITPVSLVNENTDICFALNYPVDSELLTILNKAINSLTVEEKNTLLNQNMVAIGTDRYSLESFIYADPIAFAVTMGIILIILLGVTVLVARSRIKAAAIQGELERAEAENQAKGEFLSRMSHEIRTPMNAVIGLTDLTVRMDDVPELVRENLMKIRSSARYLLSLINDILDMSQIDSGMLSIVEEAFSMEQVVDNISSMMEGEGKRRGVAFTIEKQIIHSNLAGDPIRLRQVITNLLSNAFKFTPEGGQVRFCVTELSEKEGSASFLFQVIDTGIGIHREDQDRIFESFEQIGSSTSRSQGTGLGLAISFNIVKLMGGQLKLKSEPGQGSEFYYTVTFKVNEVERKIENFSKEKILSGVHILLVEDNDLNAEIAIQLLEMQGAVVEWKQNGQQAVEYFKVSEPGKIQIILMDILMPVMNGLEAAKAIRQMERPDATAIPIIAMTANSFQKDVDMAKDAGMTAFVSKPLDVNYLYTTLRDMLANEFSDTN